MPVANVRRCVAVVAFVLALAGVRAALAGDDEESKRQKEAARWRYYEAAPLTKQKTAYIHEVIRLSFLEDTGQLPFATGPDREAIRKAFNALEIDCLPILIGWMDIAANQNATCPLNIFGRKLETYVWRGGNEDPETAFFIQQNLGKRLTVKDLPIAYKSLQAITRNKLKSHRDEKEFILQRMKPEALFNVAKALDAAKKPWEFELTLGYVARQKDRPEVFEFLLGTLEKASTPELRKVARAALVQWSGVDHGPTSFDSPGATIDAVRRWREWRENPAAKKQSGQ